MPALRLHVVSTDASRPESVPRVQVAPVADQSAGQAARESGEGMSRVWQDANCVAMTSERFVDLETHEILGTVIHSWPPPNFEAYYHGARLGNFIDLNAAKQAVEKAGAK